MLCGVAPDDERILHYFDQVVYLKLDDESLNRHIASRAENDYGKNPAEIATILERKHMFDQRYETMGAFMIDATQTPDESISEVLKLLGA